jgi:hypothetical protein
MPTRIGVVADDDVYLLEDVTRFLSAVWLVTGNQAVGDQSDRLRELASCLKRDSVRLEVHVGDST